MHLRALIARLAFAPTTNARSAMTLAGITLLLGLVLVLSVSCQQPGRFAAAQITPVQISNCSSQGINDGNAFVSKKLRILPAGVVLDSPAYQPPAGASAAGTIYSNDVAAAFGAAPPWFQDQLCDLSTVYINPDLNASEGVFFSSWGYRNPRTASKYIAISEQLWGPQGQGPAITFETYETQLLGALLLNYPGLQYQAAGYNSAKLTSGQLAILAALAHERGHILWYLVNNVTPGQGGSYTPKIICSDGRSFFVDWRSVDRPPIWRTFGDLQDNHPLDADGVTSDNVQASDLFNAAARKNRKAEPLLTAIYSRHGRWASAFASFSPDEDFVETFKLFVLTDPNGVNLISLPLYINGNLAGDIAADLASGNKKNPDLMAKINNCIVPYVGAQPLPLVRLR